MRGKVHFFRIDFEVHAFLREAHVPTTEYENLVDNTQVAIAKAQSLNACMFFFGRFKLNLAKLNLYNLGGSGLQSC